MPNVIRKIVGVITLSVFNLFIGCSNPIEPTTISPITFELEAGLSMDSNGYYRLTIDMDRWQTLHRISGHVYRDGDPMNVTKFAWASNFYWILNDTLGHIVQEGLTDDLVYVSYDTTYITGFDGWEVPIVNGASYSNEDGEVNTMIAPVQTMIGDTAPIFYVYHDEWTYEDTYGEFNIIFD